MPGGIIFHDLNKKTMNNFIHPNCHVLWINKVAQCNNSVANQGGGG
jgi:hypothetical protein